jgi:hypothetical protein|tara:strand:- start:214 stop:384 length:171 start_codon:yes stop_codon:yes gene_type:complete
VAAVEEINLMVHNEGIKNGSDELKAAVSAEFQQWLRTSGKLREISDLLALGKVCKN